MKYIDITRPIHPNMPIYPGNPPVDFMVHEGESSTHTQVTFGTHTGTHVDAPRHVFSDGAGVESIGLEVLVGQCRVLDMRQSQECVRIADLEPHNIQPGERILVRTKNSDRLFDKFYEDFVYLDGDAAQWLAEREIVLFGIDYLSVKKKGGSDHRPHTALLSKGVVIVEGLDLSEVSQGTYRASILPLPFNDLDGSPVRAILEEEK